MECPAHCFFDEPSLKMPVQQSKILAHLIKMFTSFAFQQTCSNRWYVLHVHYVQEDAPFFFSNACIPALHQMAFLGLIIELSTVSLQHSIEGYGIQPLTLL